MIGADVGIQRRKGLNESVGVLGRRRHKSKDQITGGNRKKRKLAGKAKNELVNEALFAKLINL